MVYYKGPLLTKVCFFLLEVIGRVLTTVFFGCLTEKQLCEGGPEWILLNFQAVQAGFDGG